MTAPLTVLLTGAGAPGVAGTIHCLRRNEDGRQVRIVGVDISEDAVGRWLADDFATVPAPEDGTYLDVLAGHCKRFRVDVVLPQTTREIAVLAKAKGAAGLPVVVVGSATAIELANDKLATYGAFAEAGLPVPKHAAVHDAAEIERAARELGYPGRPVVVKPPVSNGMRGLRVLTAEPLSFERFLSEKPAGERTTLEDFVRICATAQNLPTLLMSEYLPGDEYTVDAFSGKHVAVAVPRKRTVIRSGISFVTDVRRDAEMERQTLTAARHIGLDGVFGFQFRHDAGGRPMVLECNPRVQGTMVAAAFAGANVVWMAIREAIGEPVTETPRVRDGVRLTRYWGGFAVADGAAFAI